MTETTLADLTDDELVLCEAAFAAQRENGIKFECWPEGTVERLRDLLAEAQLQINYLHGKFGETGSGNTVMERIRAELGS